MGENMTLMPALTALLASPAAKAFAARWVVTNEDEQAVSSPMQGPESQGTIRLPECSFALLLTIRSGDVCPATAGPRLAQQLQTSPQMLFC